MITHYYIICHKIIRITCLNTDVDAFLYETLNYQKKRLVTYQVIASYL